MSLKFIIPVTTDLTNLDRPLLSMDHGFWGSRHPNNLSTEFLKQGNTKTMETTVEHHKNIDVSNATNIESSKLFIDLPFSKYFFTVYV